MAYVIPTLHPAHILRGAPLSDIVIADLQKAVRVSQHGPSQQENIVVVHPASPVGMRAATTVAVQWMERWIGLQCVVAVDIETSSLNFMGTRLHSIALSGVDGCNTAVSFTLEDLHTLPWDIEAELVRALRRLLADTSVPKVFHNAPFDLAVLMQHSFIINGPVLDTISYAHLIQPDAPKDLGWIGHTYLDVEPWKLNHDGRKQAYTADVIELLIYNAKDALNTGKLLNPMRTEAYSRGVSTTLETYQMAAQRMAARMEIYGIPVNIDLRRKMGQELLLATEKNLQAMRVYLNWSEFNPNKPTHVRHALYDKLGANGHNCLGLAPTQYTEIEQDPSTSYKALIDHLEQPFIRAFVDFIEDRVAHSTMYKDGSSGDKVGAYSKAIHSDNRLHPKWNPCGQKGSRFSSSPNVQNVQFLDATVPHRTMFEAPPGRVMVGADKDQLELRIIACRAGVRELVEELQKPNADPHTLAASNIYGEAFDARSKQEQKDLRNMVKNVVYASLYNAGPTRVWHTLREKKMLSSKMRAAMTLAAVTHIHRAYFGRYVEIPVYHQRNYDIVHMVGYDVCEPFQRRRYFPVQPAPFTEVGNWRTQTEGSDHVLRAMLHLQDDYDRETHGDAQIIVHAHDALYTECAEGYGERAQFLMNHHFGDDLIEGPVGSVHLTAKARIGRNLLEVK
jgi:DNA polymerase I-like protein with 3'-5' exonuclease and polymerase domains